MTRIMSVLLVASIASPLAFAQARPSGADWSAPRTTLSVGYANVRSNAPPSQCNCFGANGGYLSAAYSVLPWFRVAGEVTGSHANHIGSLGQDLTLITYTFGPQIVVPAGRFEFFGHGLFGAAQGSDSYFPSGNSVSSSATSFAISTGGGIDIGLTRHVGVRAAQVEYLKTSFPNAGNNKQNHTVFSTGLLFRFGSAYRDDSSRNDAYKVQRDMEKQAHDAKPEAPVVAAAPPPPPPPPATSTTIAAPASSGADFDQSVESAYFNYDSYELRPDALAAVLKNATYLKSHPDLDIVVAGYADERGTAEYNIALGQKRAQAVRDQLIADGVSPSKLDVVSYGKEKPSCSDDNEACFQKNRRASLENHSR
ncbi:peptidoglycan-associated lipoprotein Pal [Terriglobus roseus]|uniref:Peptidoglycan-associated lipoprotein n=1 Tax=Terriglobus roseus TaxID=392734 RepID=A0A1G7PA47_9BACT|nr:peptidoglycan-associated lipoprotein Pal [Terriglobus roseus]SDF83084.1 peptidoglycan-associated lipoprotein [Terriglobus roseus]